jgi:thiamine-triphosphatase
MHLVSQQPHHDHPELLLPTQRPPSASVQPLPARTIHDIYYDTPDHSLCRTGAWIRLRNGEWQAKVRRGAWGGDFGNSRFEALRGEEAVGRCIQDIVGNYTIGGKGGTGNFGLAKLAEFVTEREAWMVDREFKVVRGRMVFGHEVGEVELQVEVAEDTGEVREGGADGGDG